MPTRPHGKVAYIEIPALDIQRSADFYAQVFKWKIGKRGDGSTSFDDPTGEVSGTWVIGRSATSQPGLLIYIVVDDIAETLESVIRYGGEVLQPLDADTLELIGRFRDPGGNVIGLYQDPSRVGTSN
jgi:predicted enzyme related to lactoylglutathione lyase